MLVDFWFDQQLAIAKLIRRRVYNGVYEIGKSDKSYFKSISYGYNWRRDSPLFLGTNSSNNA